MHDTEFADALDFIYQVSDEFVFDAATGAQGAVFGWSDTGDDPADADYIPSLTDRFATDIRTTYTARTGSFSGGTSLLRATQELVNKFTNYRNPRDDAAKVAIILTGAFGSQILHQNRGGEAWVTETGLGGPQQFVKTRSEIDGWVADKTDMDNSSPQ